MSLIVKPVFISNKKNFNPTQDDPALKNIPNPLPRPEFRMMLVGPSGQGKSMTAKWLLVQHYSNLFDHVILFCPTIRNDKTLSDLVNFDDPKNSPLDPDYVFETTDKNEISAIIKDLWDEFAEEELKATKKGLPFRVLFIFDDLSNEIGRIKAIENLFTKGRKINASVMIMSNSYKSYDPVVRSNLTHTLVFKPSSNEEKEKIINDIAGGNSIKTMNDMFRMIFEDNNFNKGDFIYYDKYNSGKSPYFKNFTNNIIF